MELQQMEMLELFHAAWLPMQSSIPKCHQLALAMTEMSREPRLKTMLHGSRDWAVAAAATLFP
jgi:hypothetical protein